MSHHLKDTVRDGLIYVAVISLFIFSLAIPIISFFTIWFLPLPFVILGVLQNRSTTLFVALFLTIISLFLGTELVFYIWIAFITGLFMGKVYREPHTSATQVVRGGMIGGTLGILLTLYLSMVFFNAENTFQNQWDKMWQTSQTQLKSMGVMATIEPPHLEVVIPLCILFLLTVGVLLNLWAARKWLSLKGFPGKYLPRFHNWNVPRSFFYSYLIALLLLLGIGEDTDEGMGRFLVAFITIAQAVFIVQGLSFLTFLLYIRKWSRSWVLLVVPFLVPPFLTVVEFLGILDIGLNLKERQKKS